MCPCWIFPVHLLQVTELFRHGATLVIAACVCGVASHPGCDLAVVVYEEGPPVGGYPHLPARGQEALLDLVLGLGGAVGGRLGRLGVGEGVLHRPTHLDVAGPLRQTQGHKPGREVRW